MNRVYRPSGAATAQLLTELAEALAHNGREVVVITTGHAVPPQPRRVTVVATGPTKDVRGTWARARDAARFILRARTQLKAQVRPGDLVVLMTDPPLLGALVSGVALARGGRVIHWVQDIYPEIAAVHFGAVARGLARALTGWRTRAWRRSTACIVLGERMAQTLDAAGVPPEKLRRGPNWAPGDWPVTFSETERDRIRAGWKLTDKFVVAYSGNLGRVHTFDALIDGAERLRDERGIAFVVMGDGPRLAAVKSACSKRGLVNVHFRTSVPLTDLPANLAAADIQLVTLNPVFAGLVYPSKLAGVLAASRAVVFVGPADDEIATLLRNERCGAAFASTDGAGLAAQLSTWSRQPAAVQELGQNARRVFEERFTFTAALAKWSRLLDEIGGGS